MVLASSTTSVLSMLLLMLMLLHGGLQTPVRRSAVSGTASPFSCTALAKEIIAKLNASELTDTIVAAQLRNETLQRENLCEFLKMRKKLKIEAIKTNLENLERCLPPAVDTSQMTNFYPEKNSTDFQMKLKFFVRQLIYQWENTPLRPPHPTSDSSFCPESKEQQNSRATGV